MQHGLLALGLALIAAIVAALGAPLFVDWNAWRPEFEQRASALVGTPVTIKGSIEASILPTPAFVMRDVTVGDAAQGTGLTAGQIRGILSLGALFRGAVEAEEIVFTKPTLRLTLGADGRIAVKKTEGEPGPLSVSRFTIEGGRLVLDDRANKRQYQFNDIAAAGELQSRAGPLKLEASFAQDGKPRNNAWKLRASSGQFNDTNGRARFSLTRADGLSFDADGMLSLEKAKPRFEGKINLAQPGAMPWKLAANAIASHAALKLEGLEISFGAPDAPAEFSGEAQVSSLQRGVFDAELSAKFVDLDKALGAQNKSAAAVIAQLRDTLAGFRGDPLTGKLKLSVAQLVAGGGTLRDVESVLAWRDGAPMPERLNARLPGRGAVQLSGAPLADGSFKGRWAVSAEEPAALAEWSGVLPADVMGEGSFRVDGGLLVSDQKLTLDPFLLTMGPAKLGGDLVYSWQAGGQNARLDAKLNGSTLDLALLQPLARKSIAKDNSLAIHAMLDIQSPRIFSQPARRLSASLSRNGDVIVLDRLAIEDMAGVNLSAKGEIASYADKPRGKVDFSLDAANAKGLDNLAGMLSDPDFAAYLRRVTAAAAPLQLAGSITGDGKGPAVIIEAKGKAKNAQIRLTSRGEPLNFAIDDTKLELDAPDAANLVALLGLPMPEPLAGQGHFEIAIGKKDKGAAPLRAQLVFPGIDLSADGALRFAEKIEPRINLKLEATDFRALSMAAARIRDSVVPASGTARLIRDEGGVALEDLAIDFGDTRVRGRMTFRGVEQPVLSGDLTLNRSDLTTLLALGIGRMDEAGAGALWSDAPLGTPPLAGASGDFAIQSAALGLFGNLTATGARMKLRFSGTQFAVEDLSCDLAGGKLTGQARISRPDLIAFDGKLSLEGADVSRLISPADWRSRLHGKGDVSLELAGQGASLAQLIGNIAGRGKFTLADTEIEKLSPGALAKVFAAAGKNLPDEANVRMQLAKALDDAPLKIAKLEGPIVAANGVIRAGKAVAKAGNADTVSNVSFDLSRFYLDANVTFENPAPKGMSARPAITVAWRGPIAEPARNIEIAPLMAALSLQAMDGEMRRINEQGRALPVNMQPVPPLATETPPAPKPKVSPPPRPKTAPAPQGNRQLKLDPIH
ncbi:MAG TPA: AsmA-like C-terminal region-containing protein [Xanthobacteraceae bacterium]|nr:AsmA-like C-terminal region-containing protein [Xanthobacteraceae bacterium]